jgi:hypothetical protein
MTLAERTFYVALVIGATVPITAAIIVMSVTSKKRR